VCGGSWGSCCGTDEDRRLNRLDRRPDRLNRRPNRLNRRPDRLNRRPDRLNRRLNWRPDRRLNRRPDRRLNRRPDRRPDRRLHRRPDRRLHRRLHRRLNRRLLAAVAPGPRHHLQGRWGSGCGTDEDRTEDHERRESKRHQPWPHPHITARRPAMRRKWLASGRVPRQLLPWGIERGTKAGSLS